MSQLVDEFIEQSLATKAEIDGRWYAARPIPFCYLWGFCWCWRIKDAWRVLCGRSVAVHYKECE